MGRIERLNEAFKRLISTIILDELKDPRLEFVTINHVEITKDLRYARVYFSVLGNAKKEQDAQDGLKSASGYMRKLLSKSVKLRRVPEMIFLLDTSTAYGIHISQELEKIENERKKDNPGTSET
ncbi:30S ribosome-binding factor RbfA [Candidatus Omnitrophota bacterium]